MDTIFNNPTLLNESEVSEWLQISKKSLQAARRTNMGAGAIPYVKLGRSVRYKLSDVTSYVESSTITPSNGGGHE